MERGEWKWQQDFVKETMWLNEHRKKKMEINAAYTAISLWLHHSPSQPPITV